MRSIIDVPDLTLAELDGLMKTAEDIMAHPEAYGERCRGKKLATLFFEPSTRTLKSFELVIECIVFVVGHHFCSCIVICIRSLREHRVQLLHSLDFIHKILLRIIRTFSHHTIIQQYSANVNIGFVLRHIRSHILFTQISPFKHLYRLSYFMGSRRSS